MTIYTGTVTMGNIVQELASRMIQEGWVETRVPISVVPHMSGLTTPTPYTVSSSNSIANAWHAFDGDRTGTGWASNTTSGNLNIDLGVGNGVAVNRYTVTGSSTVANSPRDWFLEGSHDGSAWTVLDTRTNSTGWAINESRTFDFANATAWRHYRIRVTFANGGSPVQIAELELLAVGNALFTERVLTSTGSRGTDNIIAIIHPRNTFAPQGNSLLLGYAETFNGVTSAFTNRRTGIHAFTSVTTTVVTTTTPIGYIFDINRDRIYIGTTVDPAVTSACNAVSYLGLMKRYSNETNNHAQCLAFSQQAPGANITTVLRNRVLTLNANYTNRAVVPTLSPSVWGDVIFVSPVFVEGTAEGMRGELDDVFVSAATNIATGDEVVVGGQRYRAVIITGFGANGFPSSCLLFKL